MDPMIDKQNNLLEEKYCIVFSILESLRYFPDDYATVNSGTIIVKKNRESYIGLKHIGFSHFYREDWLYIKGKKIKDFSKIHDDFKQLDLTQFILSNGRDVFSLESVPLKEFHQVQEILSLELQITFLKKLLNNIPKPKNISYCISFKRKFFLCFVYETSLIQIHFGKVNETIPVLIQIDDIVSIIRDYENMDISQFILSHSKDPFGLNRIPSFRLDTKEI